MKKSYKHDFLPIILGSDENAYGTARLFAEAYGVQPLLLCTLQLAPTRHSRLFRAEIVPELETDVALRGMACTLVLRPRL